MGRLGEVTEYYLTVLRDSPNPVVREAMADALAWRGSIDTSDVREAFAEAAIKDPSPYVRRAARQALVSRPISAQGEGLEYYSDLDGLARANARSHQRLASLRHIGRLLAEVAGYVVALKGLAALCASSWQQVLLVLRAVSNMVRPYFDLIAHFQGPLLVLIMAGAAVMLYLHLEHY